MCHSISDTDVLDSDVGTPYPRVLRSKIVDGIPLDFMHMLTWLLYFDLVAIPVMFYYRVLVSRPCRQRTMPWELALTT